MIAIRSRIGAIGDVHAEGRLLAAAIDHLRRHAVELILCTGDLVDGPGAPADCCKLLAAADIVTVRGNHDRWFLSGTMRDLPEATPVGSVPPIVADFLRALPLTASLSTPAGPLLLCHGLGENDMARLHPDDYGYAISVNDDLQALIQDRSVRFVLNGHTHRPMVRHFPGLTRWYFDHGVGTVWIVLPDERQVLVLHAGGESRHRSGETLPEDEQLPGLRPKVDDFFLQLGR